MNRPGLLIRADANPQIGFGHVMRCLALAQNWRGNRGPVTFACQHLPAKIQHRIESEGMAVRSIDDRCGSVEDARSVQQIAGQSGSQVVVMDGYQFGPTFQQLLQGTELLTLVVDDYAHLGRYHADIILNQNAGVTASDYEGLTGDSELLLGPDYCLLRTEFLAQSRLPSSGQLPHLLVSLGGFDPGGVTQRIIDSLEMLSIDSLSVTIVSSVPGLRISDSRIDLVRFADNMAELYSRASVAICAGGGTNWEMSLFGLPRLVVVLAENQRNIAAELEHQGCCWSLGWFEDISDEQLSDAILRLMNGSHAEMQAANRKLMDGKGAERVIQRLTAKAKWIASST